jgi:hypothetical protein
MLRNEGFAQATTVEDFQKRDWQRYEPGQIVTFAPERNRPARSATVVRVERKKVVLILASRKEIVLDLRHPDSFDVSRPRQVLTVSAIAPDGALQTKEGLCVPADFRQWCHGYVITSHKVDRGSRRRCRGTAHLQRSLRGVLSRP